MNDRQPTAISLFSGIGGLDLGLQRAGFRHLAFCEKDPYRRDVLRARFPGVPVHGDVREFAAVLDSVAGLLAPIDLVCGGFPCTDVSAAGQRRGLDGERSALFFEFARVARTVRPRWLLIENVPGLFSSHGGRDFGVVLGTLADLGYGLAWRTLNSRYFGVPQHRRRVFIVGAEAGSDPRAAAERVGEVLALGSRCREHPGPRDEAEETRELAGTLGGGTGARGWPGDTERMTFVPDGDNVRRLVPVECERLQALPEGWTDVGGSADWKRYAAIGDAVTVTVAEWLGQRLRTAA